MKTLILISTFVLFLCYSGAKIQAQVAINTSGLSPHSSAMLDVESSSKGLLFPRLTTAQRTTLGGFAIGGLVVFDNNLGKFYFHDGQDWQKFSTGQLWTNNIGKTYLTNSTDRVGIGTSSPLSKLHINDYSISNNTLYITSAINDSSRLFFGEVDDARHGMYWLYDGNSDKLELWGQQWNIPLGPHILVKRDYGEVAIGTSDILGKLHIHDNNNSNAWVYITPQAVTSEDDASIFLAEDDNATYGMYWKYNGSGNRMELWGKISTTHYGPHIVVGRSTGDVGIGVNSPASKLDVKGNITVRNTSGTIVMELGAGLDYAEGFDVSDKNTIESGTILSIDPQNPGQLKVCDMAYDKKVAGIVAGAKNLGSGVRLGVDEYDCDVALAGRVYCNVDASRAAIEPGDLLTTSFIPGYAMKAEDNQNVHGAILGKAMEKLDKGEKGQILVLVTLQ